jgi:hypothetical protein
VPLATDSMVEAMARTVSKALKQEVPDLTRLSLRNHGAFPAIHVRTIIMFGADDLLHAHGLKEMPIGGRSFTKSSLADASP